MAFEKDRRHELTENCTHVLPVRRSFLVFGLALFLLKKIEHFVDENYGENDNMHTTAVTDQLGQSNLRQRGLSGEIPSILKSPCGQCTLFVVKRAHF